MVSLRDVGIYAVRLAPFLQSIARWVYRPLPQTWHDTPTSFLKKFFCKDSDIIFIQLGAFDGVAGDPIRPLILANPGWRGALVEPMSFAFDRLKDNYASLVDRLHFFNCAVSDVSGHIEMFSIDENEIERLNLPSWAREIASVDETHINKHLPNARVSRRSVPVMKLSDIAKTCNFPKIDLLVMDVEGHEGQIILNANFSLFGTRVVVFEHKHMLKNDYEAVLRHLEKFGFKARRYGRDTVAYR